MPRGQNAEVGDTYINKNGYSHTKTADRNWIGTHILVVEGSIGRRLAADEYVVFLTKDRSDLSYPGNLELRKRGSNTVSVRSRLAAIDARIDELQAERELLLLQQAEEVNA